jgi:hypothetical protein
VKATLILLFFVCVAGVSAFSPPRAEAQFHRGRGPIFVSRGYFYDPFFDPWFGFGYQYPYPPPYGMYPLRYDNTASVRVQATPKDAEVFVDGYYAGVVDDFDGIFQRLRVPPGEHELTLHRDGYKTVRQKIYLTPRSTYKLHYTMVPLAPGDVNEPRPMAPAPQMLPPGQQPGAPYPPPYPPQRMPPPQRTPPPERVPPGPPSGGQPESSRYGTLSIRVQPINADVLIDGERWRGPDNDEHLIVQVAEGPHRVEVQKDGYQKFSTEVQVRRGETVPINVSLLTNRP